MQFVHIKCCQTAFGKCSDITSGTFDPHDLFVLTGQWVFFYGLTAGISSAIVGDSKISSQDIGAIDEKTYLIVTQFLFFFLIPEIIYMFKVVFRNAHIFSVIG